MDPSRAQLSYGMQLDFPLPTDKEINKMAQEDTDWLAVAEEFIQQDLETTVKELDLVRDVLESLEVSPRAEKKPGPSLEDQKFLIGACQEYSGSRCHMLEERLRQIRLWASSRETGQDIPDGVPDEYAIFRISPIEYVPVSTRRS